MLDEKTAKLRNRVKLGFILLFVDLIFIAAIFNLDVPYFIMIIFVVTAITLANAGMIIAIYYGIESINRSSKKTVEKVDEFLQEWERERFRKP